MRQTTGLAFGAISTKSIPACSAARRASLMEQIPSCVPSYPIRRHSRAVISSLSLGSCAAMELTSLRVRKSFRHASSVGSAYNQLCPSPAKRDAGKKNTRVYGAGMPCETKAYRIRATHQLRAEPGGQGAQAPNRLMQEGIIPQRSDFASTDLKGGCMNGPLVTVLTRLS